MKKKILICLSLIFCVCMGVFITGCDSGDEPENAVDLKYVELVDGTYEVSVDNIDNSVYSSIVIPSEYNGKSVTRIAPYGFEWCRSIDTIKLPKTIVSIGEGAFSSCYYINRFTLPSSVLSIEKYAFEDTVVRELYYDGDISNWCNIEFELVEESEAGNRQISSVSPMTFETSFYLKNGNGYSKITSLTIPQEITNIGNFQFCNFTQLSELNLHNNIQDIEEYAFYNCMGITELTLPNTIKSIGGHAFESVGIKHLTLPITLEVMGEFSFSMCDSLKGEITIPSSIVKIENGAFQGCALLEGVIFSLGVQEIGDKSFKGCSSLEILNLPSNVQKIGQWAFMDSGVETISFSEGLKEIGVGAFSNCSNLTEVKLPDSLEEMSLYAFSQCSRLTTVYMGKGENGISNGAFDECIKLKTIYIPTNIKNIYSYAFHFCGLLADIYYAGTETDWKSIGIGDGNEVIEYATIHYSSTF